MVSPLRSARATAHDLTQRLLSSRVGDAILRLWNQASVQGYLAAPGPHKLHLGCGARLLPGWLNADLPSARRLLTGDHSMVGINAARPLPFEAGTFDLVYTEHMHEHLDYASGAVLVTEIRRVLKPSGRLRLALPDLEFHIGMIGAERDFREYSEMFEGAIHKTDGLAGAPLTKNTFLNFLFRGSEHKYLYSREELKRQLEDGGFRNVRFVTPGQSDDPSLRGLESNPLGRTEDQVRLHVSYTLSVEAEPG